MPHPFVNLFNVTFWDLALNFNFIIVLRRWELVGFKGGKVQYSPFPVPLNGLPAKFYKEPTTNQ